MLVKDLIKILRMENMDQVLLYPEGDLSLDITLATCEENKKLVSERVLDKYKDWYVYSIYNFSDYGYDIISWEITQCKID